MAMRNRRILIVEDEASIRDVVHAYLEREGFEVREAAGGREGLQVALDWQPAVVVLDLMLPDLSGEEVCRRLRHHSDSGVIMLTAKAAEQQRIAGLQLGADDYVTKPFSPGELAARVRALWRRLQGGEPLTSLLRFNGGDLVIDTQRQAVQRGDQPIDLTAVEYRLLAALVRSPGRVYTRSELVERALGDDFAGDERTIDAHVKNLRQKLGDPPRNSTYIITVFGTGYKFGGKPDDAA